MSNGLAKRSAMMHILGCRAVRWRWKAGVVPTGNALRRRRSSWPGSDRLPARSGVQRIDERVDDGGHRIGVGAGGVALLAPHGLRAGLQQDRIGARGQVVVKGPLDVLRTAVVLFGGSRQPGDPDDLLVSQRRRVDLVVRQWHAGDPRAVGV